MSKLRLGDESIKFSQERFSKLEVIKENKIGGFSSYEVDSNGEITRVKFDVGDSFSDIKSVDSYGLYYAFNGCTGLTGSVSFPNLTSVGNYGLDYAFQNCKGLTDFVGFPKLTSVGDYGLESAFYWCTGLTGSVSFPELTSVGRRGLDSAFNGCTGLTGSVSFPKLTGVGDYALYNAFGGCTGITEIHFRADAQATIEAQSGYSSKFGATNATIYFDL